EPWNSAKMGFDRSLTLPHKTRNTVESMFSSEAVSFLDGGFMDPMRVEPPEVAASTGLVEGESFIEMKNYCFVFTGGD
ncbi:MAG: hypothetical protein O2960_16760, partial [Verrucomicrobia bacterium]|nr:hypothetical protein [Verrucomicrobiota bacterium]